MYEISYGKKYDKALDVKEIAAKFRADVKAQTAAGELPKGLKLSVKISRYSGGRSIRVEVVACPFPVLNQARLKAELAEPRNVRAWDNQPRHSEEARKLLETLKGLLEAYNFDGSEIQSDYFHVNFYGNVQVDWQLEKTERELAELGFSSVAELEAATKKLESESAAKTAVLDQITKGAYSASEAPAPAFIDWTEV